MSEVGLGIVVGMVICLIVITAFGANKPPRDDTDASTGPRSGMVVHTDCLTGVQYLRRPGAGLTPRLKEDGSLVVKPCK